MAVKPDTIPQIECDVKTVNMYEVGLSVGLHISRVALVIIKL